jgi:Protein of unknown function (DUF3147)
MYVRARLSALRESHWQELAIRFALGGLATVLTGVVAAVWGPLVGGLFLAFPAIMPATVTLVEKHERESKENAGLRGGRRGCEVASLEAAGAALGSIGLMAFAAVIWLTMRALTWRAFLLACAAWIVVALLCWRFRRTLRRLPR